MDSSIQHIAWVINGNSRKLDRIDFSVISDFPGEHSFFYTEHAGHGKELALKAGRSADLVIAAGGDGTLHEVVNGLMELKDKPMLTVFPLGTGNDFARNFDIIPDLVRLEIGIKNPETCSIDVGTASFQDSDAPKYFINILDVGLGAEVVKRMNHSSRYWGAQITYLWIITTSFLRFKPVMLQIQNEGKEHIAGKTISFVIANGAWFGNNIKIAPDACPNDATFHYAHLGDFSFMSYVMNLPKAKKGQHINHDKVKYGDGRSFTISGKAEVEADGEWMGRLPVKVTNISKALSFLKY